MRNLGLAGFVVVLGCTVAACAGDLEGEKAPEDTAFAGMALSAECSSCVGDALVQECSAELQACANDSGCFDVSGCLASCDPNDAPCFSQCAQSSLSFQTLSGCAFCGECAQACQGDWACGDPGPNCDPAVDPDCKPDCEEDGSCQCDDASDPNCGQQCDPAVDPNCGQQCDEDGNCQPPCDDVDQNGGCVPQCDDPNDPSCGGGGQCDQANTCEECAYCAVGNQCQGLLEDCQNDQGCQGALECITQCGPDPQCAQNCMDLAANGGSDAVQLIECVGGTCGQLCGC